MVLTLKKKNYQMLDNMLCRGNKYTVIEVWKKYSEIIVVDGNKLELMKSKVNESILFPGYMYKIYCVTIYRPALQ